MRDWLVAIRKSKGLSQKELSDAVGVAQPTYCNIENGSRRPSPELAQKIAEALNFEWTRFFEESD